MLQGCDQLQPEPLHHSRCVWVHVDLRLHDHVQRICWGVQQVISSTACRWYCTAGETVEHQGGFFVTEDQGHSWHRLLRGSDGSPAAGKQGIPYILGLALNPWRQGEILITAADNAPGGVYCCCSGLGTCMHVLWVQLGHTQKAASSPLTEQLEPCFSCTPHLRCTCMAGAACTDDVSCRHWWSCAAQP